MVQHASQENSMQMKLPDGLQSGDLVAVLIPFGRGVRKLLVGLVLSVWTSVKKPKLATAPAALTHVVAARIVIMEGQPCNKVFTCSSLSQAWVIKPESIVGILAFDKMADESASCTIELTEESMTMLTELENKSVQDWWPQPEKDSQGLMNVRHVGLFVRGQARRRRVQRVLRAGAKAKAKAKAKAAAKKTSTKKTLKKSKTKKAIPDVVKNFRRNGIGVTLVQQKMEKARILDETKFVENKVFTEDTHQCRLKLPKCNGKLWADVLAKAHPFFVASFKTSKPAAFAESVAKRFSTVFKSLESQPPERKHWILLIKDICEFLDSCPK